MNLLKKYFAILVTLSLAVIAFSVLSVPYLMLLSHGHFLSAQLYIFFILVPALILLVDELH